MATIHGIQPSFAKGELSPALWARIDLAAYAIGCRTLLNMVVHPHGGASNRPGTEYIGTCGSTSSVRLIPFEFSTEQTYILEFGPQYIRVYADGARVGSVEVSTPYLAADIPNIRFTQSADVLFLACAGHAPRKLSRTGETTWALDLVEFKNGPFQDENTGDVTLTLGPKAGLATEKNMTTSVTASAALFSASDVGRWIKIRYYKDGKQLSGGAITMSGDYVSDAWPVDGNWEFKYWFYGSITDGAVNARLEYSTDDGTTWSVFEYMNIRAGQTWQLIEGELRAEDWNGVMPQLRVASTSMPPNYFYWSLNQIREEAQGFLQIRQYNSETSVAVDVMQDAQFYESTTAMWSLGSWGDGPGWPETVMFYQDRLVYANSASERNKVWLSKTGDYVNFGQSIELQDDDSVTVSIPARSVNAIRNLIPLREMIGFSSGGIWSIAPGGNGDALTPSSVKVALETTFRAGTLTPVTIGNVILYAQAYGNRAYSLAYSDAVYGYDGSDMSVMSQHLFSGHSIVSWAYQQEPWSSVWAVRDDGALLALTFLKEHQVAAWSRHLLGGSSAAVKSVAVIPGSESDEIWMVVKRGSNQYIERLHERKTASGDVWFVDSAVEVTQGASRTVSGLSHLAGQTVAGVADGVAFSGKTVSAGGTITLDSAASHVIAGLPYVSDLETLNIEYDTGSGTAQGRKKRVAEVVLRLENSRGGYVGPDAARLKPLLYPSGATFPYTGDVRVTLDSSFDEGGRVLVRQTAAYPITVLGVLPVVVTGG